MKAIKEVFRATLASLAVFCLVRAGSPAMAEEVRLTTRLDESQVVRPTEFQPPVFGTGSPGTGWANVVVNTETAEYTIEMEVTGVDPGILDNTVGPNMTAIHVHAGASHARGPFTIDVHHYARQDRPGSNGLTPIDGGFRLETGGAITQVQGALDTTFTPAQIIEFLRTESSFIAVHTNSNELFRTGAIRGNFSVMPEVVRLRASVDESHVVRPAEFRPPVFGTGSPGTGVAFLTVNTVTGAFRFDFEVEGVDPSLLDNTVGPNGTGIHVHRAPPGSRGPFIIDVHHFAREALPETNGLILTADGFRLHAEGEITQVQGALDTTFTAGEIIGFLSREDETFVAVHTTSNDLFRTGAIRGNFEPIPRGFVRSDCNGDRRTDLADVIFSLERLFGEGETPGCLEACNVNDDSEYNISDPVNLLVFLFEGGSPPAAPFPICAVDPDGRGGLGCLEGTCD